MGKKRKRKNRRNNELVAILVIVTAVLNFLEALVSFFDKALR